MICKQNCPIEAVKFVKSAKNLGFLPKRHLFYEILAKIHRLKLVPIGYDKNIRLGKKFRILVLIA